MSQALPVLIFWCCSVTQTCQTLWLHIQQEPRTHLPFKSPSVLFKAMSFESTMLFSHLTLCRSLLLLHSIFPSISFFPVIFLLASRGWYIGSSCAASVLLRIIWNHFLHTLLVWTPFSPCFLQPSCCKASIFWQSVLVFLLTPPYITPENQLWPFRSFSIISQLCNMVLRLAIAFHPMGKCLLVSWLQSHHTVISEIKKVKRVINSTVSHQHISKWWGRIPWSYFLCLLACLFVFVLSFNPAFSISPFTFSF